MTEQQIMEWLMQHGGALTPIIIALYAAGKLFGWVHANATNHKPTTGEKEMIRLLGELKDETVCVKDGVIEHHKDSQLRNAHLVECLERNEEFHRGVAEAHRHAGEALAVILSKLS